MDDDLIVAIISTRSNKHSKDKPLLKVSKGSPKIVLDADEFRHMSWRERFRYHPKMTWVMVAISAAITLSIICIIFL